MFGEQCNSCFVVEAERLRAVCSISKVGSSLVRFVPFGEVFRCRQALCEFQNEADAKIFYNISEKTLVKRLQVGLAGEGIILKKLGYRRRSYVSVEPLDNLVSFMSRPKASSAAEVWQPTPIDLQNYLDSVSEHFRASRDNYWNVNWSLTEEILSIPRALLTDIVLRLASDRRLSTLRLAAKECFHAVTDIFPVSNSRGCLPETSIEDLLSNGSDCPRVDILLALMTLKVIEQLVFYRSSGVSGPLIVAVPVSGICEVTPSFVSLLNSIGIFLYFNMTEKYRQQLIADRKRQGLWDWGHWMRQQFPFYNSVTGT